MAKKEKAGVNKVVKKVSDEFEKTSSHLETLVNDAFRQFDNLQNQIHEPVKKLIEEMEALREREMKRFSEELDRRLKDFHEIQQNILERVGMSSGKASSKKDAVKNTTSRVKGAAASAKTASDGKAVTRRTKKATSGKAGTKKQKASTPSPVSKTSQTATAKKPKSAGKTTAKTAASPGSSTRTSGNSKASGNSKKAGTTSKAATKKTSTTKSQAENDNDLTRIKGVGPATAEKMRAIGITSIQQIATPSDADDVKLQEFSKMRGFNTWRAEAKKLLA